MTECAGDRDQAAEHLASALSAFEAAGAPRRVAAVRRLAESLGVELSAGAAARVRTASPEDR